MVITPLTVPGTIPPPPADGASTQTDDLMATPMDTTPSEFLPVSEVVKSTAPQDSHVVSETPQVNLFPNPPTIVTEPPTPPKRDRAASDLIAEPTTIKRARLSSVADFVPSEEVILPVSGLSMPQVDFSTPLADQPGRRKYEVGFIKVASSIDNLLGEYRYIINPVSPY